MNVYHCSLLSLAVLFLIVSNCDGQTDTRYFYKGYDYGTQSEYSPLYLLLNGSYDILQSSNRDNKILSIHYATGARNVFENITSPLPNISRYGWKNFLETEIFPTNLNIHRSQYWPNYNLHLLGGGMTYVAMTEWFSYHGYAYPKTLSIATMFAYHYLNETVENNNYVGANVDPVADLLIFDPLGIALFSIRGVPKFFGKTLQMADWSFQPLMDIQTDGLLNNGQNFSFKIPIPYEGKWKLLYITGMEGVVGVSYQYTETDNISLGGGLATKDLVDVNNDTGVRTVTATLVRVGGIYYDRNNSLLASLIFKNAATYKVRLNVYPGVFDFGGFSLGFVGILHHNNEISLGIFTSFSPIGPGFSF